jgi:hypothetical protein
MPDISLFNDPPFSIIPSAAPLAAAPTSIPHAVLPVLRGRISLNRSGRADRQSYRPPGAQSSAAPLTCEGEQGPLGSGWTLLRTLQQRQCRCRCPSACSAVPLTTQPGQSILSEGRDGVGAPACVLSMVITSAAAALHCPDASLTSRIVMGGNILCIWLQTRHRHQSLLMCQRLKRAFRPPRTYKERFICFM